MEIVETQKMTKSTFCFDKEGSGRNFSNITTFAQTGFQGLRMKLNEFRLSKNICCQGQNAKINKKCKKNTFFSSFCCFLLFYDAKKNTSEVLRSPKPLDTLARRLHLTAKITSIWPHSQYFPCCYRTLKKTKNPMTSSL